MSPSQPIVRDGGSTHSGPESGASGTRLPASNRSRRPAGTTSRSPGWRATSSPASTSRARRPPSRGSTMTDPRAAKVTRCASANVSVSVVAGPSTAPPSTVHRLASPNPIRVREATALQTWGHAVVVPSAITTRGTASPARARPPPSAVSRNRKSSGSSSAPMTRSVTPIIAARGQPAIVPISRTAASWAQTNRPATAVSTDRRRMWQPRAPASAIAPAPTLAP